MNTLIRKDALDWHEHNCFVSNFRFCCVLQGSTQGSVCINDHPLKPGDRIRFIERGTQNQNQIVVTLISVYPQEPASTPPKARSCSLRWEPELVSCVVRFDPLEIFRQRKDQCPDQNKLSQLASKTKVGAAPPPLSTGIDRPLNAPLVYSRMGRKPRQRRFSSRWQQQMTKHPLRSRIKVQSVIKT